MDTVSYKDALHLKIHQDKPAREPHSRAVQDSAEATETLINKPQVRKKQSILPGILMLKSPGTNKCPEERWALNDRGRTDGQTVKLSLEVDSRPKNVTDIRTKQSLCISLASKTIDSSGKALLKQVLRYDRSEAQLL